MKSKTLAQSIALCLSLGATMSVVAQPPTMPSAQMPTDEQSSEMPPIDGQGQMLPPGSEGQQPPPSQGSEGQQPPPPQGSEGQQPPPPQGSEGQQPPPPPGSEGQQPPPPPGSEGQQPPPPQGSEGQQPPPSQGSEGQQPPPSQGSEGQQRPGHGGISPCSEQQMGSPEEFGIEPDQTNFDNMAPEIMCSLRPKHFNKMPAQAFRGMGAEHFKHTEHDALGAMTPEQFSEVLPEAMQGLEAHNMGGFQADVIHQFGPEHVAQLDSNEFQQMSTHGIAKMMVNVNAEIIMPDDVRPLLPEDWEVEDNGTMKPPAGAKLAFPPKHHNKPLPPQVKLPELPDASKGFGLGGQVPPGTEMLSGLNQGLGQGGLPQFTMMQRDEGILTAEGSGEYAGLSVAVMPDVNGMTQADENTPIGLAQDESGKFVITTPEQQRVPMIPAPKDPESLLDVIPGEGRVEIGEQGDVYLGMPGQPRPYVVGMVDPFVEVAPSDKGPGIHFMQKPEGEEEAMIIYNDGSMQKMRPTCFSPNQFIETGMKFDGVEKITHRMDGTFDVEYQGQPLQLAPTFDVQSELLEEDEEVEPEITIEPDGNLEYTVPNGNQLLRMKLIIR